MTHTALENQIEYQALIVIIDGKKVYGKDVLYEDAPEDVAATFEEALNFIIAAIEDPGTPDSAITPLEETFAQFCKMRFDYETRLLRGEVIVRDPKGAGIRYLPKIIQQHSPEDNVMYRNVLALATCSVAVVNRRRRNSA